MTTYIYIYNYIYICNYIYIHTVYNIILHIYSTHKIRLASTRGRVDYLLQHVDYGVFRNRQNSLGTSPTQTEISPAMKLMTPEGL